MTEEFEQLYRDYFQFIYLYALSLTRDEDLAEEITQETFFRAMEHIDRFEGRSRATTWLCRIAKNLYLSHCRDSRRFAAEASPEDLPAADTPGRTNQHRAGRTAGQKDLETALIDREQAIWPSTRYSTGWRSPTGKSFSCASSQSCPSPRSGKSSAGRKVGPERPTTGRKSK